MKDFPGDRRTLILPRVIGANVVVSCGRRGAVQKPRTRPPQETARARGSRFHNHMRTQPPQLNKAGNVPGLTGLDGAGRVGSGPGFRDEFL